MADMNRILDLQKKKALYEERKKTLEEQIASTEKQLVEKYGPDWEVKYKTALETLEHWEIEHAS